MSASGSDGDGRRPGAGLTAAARVRSKGPDFSPSFRALQEAVRVACAPRTRWEEKLVAVIEAVLEFAATDPAAARALTIQARRGDPEMADRQDQVLSYFTELLAKIAPAETPLGGAGDPGIVDTGAAIVPRPRHARTEKQLPELAPELVYVALLRYTGLAEARRWAESAALSRA